jgi:hypothetical protein
MTQLNHVTHEIGAPEARSNRGDIAGIPGIAIVGYAKSLKGIDPHVLVPTNMFSGVSLGIQSGLGDVLFTPIEIDAE